MWLIPNSAGQPEPVNEREQVLREKAEIHSDKAHRCVDKVRAKGHAESNSWAICTTSIGKRGVYAKGHGGNANPKRKIHEAHGLLTEYNTCHSPQDGKFCSTPGDGGGGGRSGTGSRDLSDHYAESPDRPGWNRSPEPPKPKTKLVLDYSTENADHYKEVPVDTPFQQYVRSKGRQTYDAEGRILPGQSGGNTSAVTDPAKLKAASIDALANVIRRDWGPKVNFAARPYLTAMMRLNKISDMFGADEGRSVVSYFLSNASSWRGPVAKAVKAELKRRLKEG